MKIFLDTAHLESIEKAKETGLVEGITTNPTHLSKEGGESLVLLKKICRIVYPADVSIEITQKEASAVYNQAHEIYAIAPNVVVKIPCVMNYASLIQKLVLDGVAVNITLVFSANQGFLMSKLGVKYISPFIGRLDDIDADGINLIFDLKRMLTNYNLPTQILAASLRSPLHFHAAALSGADTATVPVHLFESLLNHPLTDQGIELFDRDWKKLGITKFP